MNPQNCNCSVADNSESSTTESRAGSEVNSSSKFDVSIADSYGQRELRGEIDSCVELLKPNKTGD